MQTRIPRKREEAAFATTSRKEIAQEALVAISNTRKNKIQESLDKLLALTLKEETATEMIADTLMKKTVVTVNRRNTNLLTFCVKKQSKKATAPRAHALVSMGSGTRAENFANRRQKEKSVDSYRSQKAADSNT